jgi:cation transport protein ChaC
MRRYIEAVDDARQHSADLAALADAMPAEIAALRAATAPVWIFAYGSLIWSPEFAYEEAATALLPGWHRRFCLYSYDYRGTRERPGLVLGLDRGGACRGMAFRLSPTSLDETIDRLWAREMTAPRVYDMRRLTVQLPTGAETAYGFTVRRDHPDYVSRLADADAARLIRDAAGSRGRCRDYFASTFAHLEDLGIVDRPLRRLAARIGTISAA